MRLQYCNLLATFERVIYTTQSRSLKYRSVNAAACVIWREGIEFAVDKRLCEALCLLVAAAKVGSVSATAAALLRCDMLYANGYAFYWIQEGLEAAIGAGRTKIMVMLWNRLKKGNMDISEFDVLKLAILGGRLSSIYTASKLDRYTDVQIDDLMTLVIEKRAPKCIHILTLLKKMMMIGALQAKLRELMVSAILSDNVAAMRLLYKWGFGGTWRITGPVWNAMGVDNVRALKIAVNEFT